MSSTLLHQTSHLYVGLSPRSQAQCLEPLPLRFPQPSVVRNQLCQLLSLLTGQRWEKWGRRPQVQDHPISPQAAQRWESLQMQRLVNRQFRTRAGRTNLARTQLTVLWRSLVDSALRRGLSGQKSWDQRSGWSGSSELRSQRLPQWQLSLPMLPRMTSCRYLG